MRLDNWLGPIRRLLLVSFRSHWRGLVVCCGLLMKSGSSGTLPNSTVSGSTSTRRFLLSLASFHVLPSHVIFGAFRPRNGEFRDHRRIAALCFPIQFGSRFGWQPPSDFVTEEWQDPMAHTMGLTQPTIRL